jgi:6-phosphogluconolactonase
MQETSTGSTEQVVNHVARWLASALRTSIREHGRGVFAVPGGRSVAAPLQLLALQDVGWERVHIVFVDERHLPAGDSERNDRAVAEFIDSIRRRGFPDSSLHPAPFIPGNPEEAARRYCSVVHELGRPDVLLLGVGEDGHIASLFPGRTELEMDEPGVVAVRDAPKPPPERITMTPGLIATVPSACLLFLGRGKRAAYERYRLDGLGAAECPAKLARVVPHLLVAADDDAGGTQTDSPVY